MKNKTRNQNVKGTKNDTYRTKRTSDSIFVKNKTRNQNVKWTKNDVYGTERTSDLIFVWTSYSKHILQNTCGTCREELCREVVVRATGTFKRIRQEQKRMLQDQNVASGSPRLIRIKRMQIIWLKAYQLIAIAVGATVVSMMVVVFFIVNLCAPRA